MGNQNKIAISKSEINRLMLEIIDYSNDVKIILNKINDLVNETSSYYDCSSGDLLRNRYALFSSNCDKVVKGIMSYNKDLRMLKKKYLLNMQDLSETILKDASKIDAPNKYEEGR